MIQKFYGINKKGGEINNFYIPTRPEMRDDDKRHIVCGLFK